MQFAIATAVSVALNLAVNALTADYEGNADNKAVLKSSFGFPIEKPFGKTRLRSRNVIWGLPIEDENTSGGKGGGKKEAASYATFAVMGGWGRIKRVTKIWIDSELFFEFDGTDYFGAVAKAKKRTHFDGLHIFYGQDGQVPSSIIEQYEGVGNVPAYKGRFYLVFLDLQVRAGGSYPVVDIEVECEDDEKTLPQVLRWACKQKGLTDAQIEIDPVLNQYTQVNIDFEQNGGTVADFIKELQKTYFFIVVDTGDRLIFKDYATPETEIITALKLDNLAATEDGETAIDRYMQEIPDDLDLPSEVQFEYVSAANNYDLGHQPAFRHDAKHYNDMNLRTKQVLTDTEGSNIAWKTLELLWTQSRRLEKLLLLPSIGNQIQLGSLFTLPIDGTITYFQTETKEIGNNDLVEISAVSYDKISPNFVLDNPTYPNDPTPEIAVGEAIALDIPLIQDSDSDFGIYLGVTSEGNWKYGTIFYSDNDGNSYEPLTDFTGKTTTGTVTQIPISHDPNYTDYGSEIIVSTTGILESIDELDFLNLKQMGLFGSELIAWQNAELIATNTYKLTKLLRGLRGTDGKVNQHSLGERFVLLKGTNARLVRVPGSITDLGKTLLFKAVHGGQTLDEITTETSLFITGEALKPYSPANPEVLKNTSTNDLIVEWSLRTRRYGQWRDRVDIIQSDSDRSVIEILAGNGTVVHSAEVTGYQASYNFTGVLQVQKLGGLQSELNFNLYQKSDFIGAGKKLEIRGMQPTKFV